MKNTRFCHQYNYRFLVPFIWEWWLPLIFVTIHFFENIISPHAIYATFCVILDSKMAADDVIKKLKMALIAEMWGQNRIFSLQIYWIAVMHLLSNFHLHSFNTCRVVRKGHILATFSTNECQKAPLYSLEAFLCFQNATKAMFSTVVVRLHYSCRKNIVLLITIEAFYCIWMTFDL